MMENVQSFIHVNETISRRFLMENEGLPTIICGNIVAHIVDNLQSPEDNKYAVKSFSEVSSDLQNNKKTDYVIFRFINERTVLVMELKLSLNQFDVKFMHDCPIKSIFKH